MQEFRPSGVCSRLIHFDVTAEGSVHGVRFEGGCSGNLQGIARLVEGMPVTEVIQRLRGICCGDKTTSCPDQLVRALNAHAKQAAADAALC